MSENMKVRRDRYSLLRALRRQGIVDPHVLHALETVPREEFVPDRIRSLAYDNHALGIGLGQTISQPYIVGLMTQALHLEGTERVLEIGTGSGYQTTVLARLSASVYTIERLPSLSHRAQALLDWLGVDNVQFRIGDGSTGWPEEAPFERIIVTAAAPHVPKSLVDQLADRGRLVVPVGDRESQKLISVQKLGGRLVETFLCDCRFVSLIGAGAWPDDAAESTTDNGDDSKPSSPIDPET